MIQSNRLGLGVGANGNPGKTVLVKNTSAVDFATLRDVFGYTQDEVNGDVLIFSNLASAVSACRANVGDVIKVAPGYTESVSSSTALTLSKAGVTIEGLGEGGARPTITLDTAATATINVSAANVVFKNMLFVANYADVASAFTLTTAKDFTVLNCEFKDTSNILNLKYIVDTDATSNNADGLRIENSKRIGDGATSATAVIKMDGTNDRLTFKNNYVAHKATSTAGFMPIATGKVVTNMICESNTFNLVGSAGATTGILITTDGSTNSGVISKNFVRSLDATSEILVTASSGFAYFDNKYAGAADTSGYLLPVSDS